MKQIYYWILIKVENIDKLHALKFPNKTDKKKEITFICEGNKLKKNEKGKLVSNQNKKACQ